jgi:hypothetical protein
METQGYGQYIGNQIRSWPVKKAITTVEIAVALANAFNMDIERAKKITNVNMKRLVDKGELVRVHRGIYGKVRETPFGKLKPRPDEILTGFLLRDGESKIGYIAGPTLLNALGLSSLIPAKRHIVSNRYRYQLPVNTQVCVYKPMIAVNDENVLYLQMLEAIMAMEQYPVDTDKSDHVLRAILRNGNINNEKLIWHARRLCRYKALLKTIDIALGGDGH